MIDLTNEFKGSDVRLKVTGSKLTRLDILLNRLDKLAKNLDMNQSITVKILLL